MNRYFSLQDTIFDVTEKYPALIDLFASHGFENLRKDSMRRTLGKSITIETALKSKQIDVETFARQMTELIESDHMELGSGLVDTMKQRDDAQVHIMGVLPCPIRIQMLEKLDHWVAGQDTAISYQLQAASMGIDWLKEQVRESRGEEDLADVYLSAGYGFFFDKELMGKYRSSGTFEDMSGITRLNGDFENDYINLRDPRGWYNIIGVVPAIFMVNTELLGDRPMPESWEDLLKPEFENTMAIPMQDLDIFNAILLGIYKTYGKEGLAALGRGLHTSMHPAQMVKSGTRRSDDTPIITIMPYFFSWMAKEGGPMKAVWPKDGAIISPIFFLAKKSSREKVKPVVDFLFSESMGSVLSADGKFPSTHPRMDNHLGADKKFIWPGWEFIHNHDIAAVLEEAGSIFFNGTGVSA